MEQKVHSAVTEEQRDVWRRVSPTLNPWPGADAVGKALRDGAIGEKAEALTPADAATLPGAEVDPCCMGTEAESDLDVVTGFIEDEQSERRQLQSLARQSPSWERQTLMTLAVRAAARARRLCAAYYLIVGEAYLPALCTERIYVGKWLPALRERYHSLACTGMNYERAADGTPDPCLGALFRELGADAYQSADAVTRMLERSLAM